jgi:hypothetical protein
MYLEIGLLSICATSAGIYYCINNKLITRENIEKCFENVDNKIQEIEISANKYLSNMDVKLNELIEDIQKTFEEEEGNELGEIVELLAERQLEEVCDKVTKSEEDVEEDESDDKDKFILL